MADTATPRAPFGATVAGVTALVPTARLTDTPVPAPGPGERVAVTVSQVEAWLDQLSGRVAMRLDGWQRLPTTIVEPETTSDRDQLVAFARDLVQTGAAHYLEAARFPERVSPAATSYADVLWARFLEGLTELTGWLERRLADGVLAEDPAEVAASAPAASFPAPLFLDGFSL